MFSFFCNISEHVGKHSGVGVGCFASDGSSKICGVLCGVQVKEVADLFALCWQSGEVVTYTPDPEKAIIWLNNYSGTCVQEYVKLERLQEALAGNSPVTPDGYALVPVEPTDEMIVAAMDSDDVTYNESDDTVFYVHHREIYKAMLAAAPKPETGPCTK